MSQNDFTFMAYGDADLIEPHDMFLIDGMKGHRKFIHKFKAHPCFLIQEKRQTKEAPGYTNIKGYLNPNMAAREMVKAIEEMIDPPQKKKKILDAMEIVFLSALGEGASNKDIARRYDLSLSFVKNRLSRLYDKIKVKNRTQAALIAREFIL